MKSSILKELQRIELAIRGIDPLADIAELEQAQSDMQALIVALQAEDSSLQAQISGNDTDISALQAADTSLQSQISGNDTDISALQAADTSLQAQISGNDTDISALQAADTSLQSQISGNDTDISALQAADTSLQSQISGNDTDISALQAADTSLQSQISGNDTDISGHNSRISALEASGGSGGGIDGYIYAADVKPQGTKGGTFTAGAWRTRTLNTLDTNLVGVSLASNVVSGIPAGEYIINGRVPAYNVDRHVAMVVTSQGTASGSTGWSQSGAQDTSEFRLYITFTATATIRVDHRCQSTHLNHGLGVEAGFGPEIYTELLILKIG